MMPLHVVKIFAWNLWTPCISVFLLNELYDGSFYAKKKCNWRHHINRTLIGIIQHSIGFLNPPIELWIFDVYSNHVTKMLCKTPVCLEINIFHFFFIFNSIRGLAFLFWNVVQTIYTLLGHGEFLPSRNVTDEWVALYCDEEVPTAEVCYNVLFLIAGPDPELLNTVRHRKNAWAISCKNWN